MGVFALLDEECLFPKGGDKSFLEKLNKNHAGKSPNYVQSQRKGQQKDEFELSHYAGTVRSVTLHTKTLSVYTACQLTTKSNLIMHCMHCISDYSIIYAIHIALYMLYTICD